MYILYIYIYITYVHNVFTLLTTLTMRELRHWPSIAGKSPQNHFGDEVWFNGLSSLFNGLSSLLG